MRVQSCRARQIQRWLTDQPLRRLVSPAIRPQSVTITRRLYNVAVTIQDDLMRTESADACFTDVVLTPTTIQVPLRCCRDARRHCLELSWLRERSLEQQVRFAQRILALCMSNGGRHTGEGESTHCAMTRVSACTNALPSPMAKSHMTRKGILRIA